MDLRQEYHFTADRCKLILNCTLLKLFSLTILYIIPISVYSQIGGRTPQEIARMASQSTVVLIFEDVNGNLSYGSGFFINPRDIVTNYHVIEGVKNGIAKLVSAEIFYSIEGTIALDKDNDLAILRVSEYGPRGLLLGDSDKLEVGETIYVFGSPSGLEGTFSHGMISSIRTYRQTKRIQITAPLSYGSSGGPVFNNKGEVIGAVYATIVDGQNLNFAIPSNYIFTLSRQSGLIQPLAEVSRSVNNNNFLFNWKHISTASIAIRNNTNYRIDYLFISASESSSWDVDMLGSKSSFRDRESLEYYVTFGDPCSHFDVMAIDLDGDVYYKWRQRICDYDSKYVNITFDDRSTNQFNLSLTQLDIYNKTGYTITHLFIYPTGSDELISDILGSTKTLNTNHSVSILVHNDKPASSYMLVALDEDSDIYTKRIQIRNSQKRYEVEIRLIDLEQ